MLRETWWSGMKKTPNKFQWVIDYQWSNLSTSFQVCACLCFSFSPFCAALLGLQQHHQKGTKHNKYCIDDHLIDLNVFAVALCKRKQKNIPILWLSLTHLTSDKQHNSCSSSALSSLSPSLRKQLFFRSILNGTENIVNGSIFYPTKFDSDTWKIVG